LVEAHEIYRIGQAAPWWEPPELTGLQLLALPHIHQIYEGLRLQQQAELMRGAFGG
jgi:hypothetical protein